jgi:hypothetical protein
MYALCIIIDKEYILCIFYLICSIMHIILIKFDYIIILIILLNQKTLERNNRY